ncbi:hypothetical protein EDB92DRAFT_1950706 [Lactarius akahatsu]|uniref:Uncharacterized protein n=1 Tax=Lactarius akahatsu TaxID=416441 RepID=A0AAD4QA26_9AGAM|nr:hypothetical protein EDB92DRAFT_1950706 [Lactarius akahatsu]
MLPQYLLRSLNGPIPTPFTGDLTHAVQFIQDLDRLVWKNPNHPLVFTPWLRIDLALSFVSGPTTMTWKHGIRQGHLPGIPIESLWDKFLDSFCETWVHSPEATASVPAPAARTPTENVSSPPPATDSTKHVEDVLIAFAAEELLQQHASETTDQTTDAVTGEQSLLASCAPVSLASLATLLAQITPVDEEPLVITQRIPLPQSPLVAANSPSQPVVNEVHIIAPRTHTLGTYADTVLISSSLHTRAPTELAREYVVDQPLPHRHPHPPFTRRHRPLPPKHWFAHCPIIIPRSVKDLDHLFVPQSSVSHTSLSSTTVPVVKRLAMIAAQKRVEDIPPRLAQPPTDRPLRSYTFAKSE